MFKIIKGSAAIIIAASFFVGCGGDEPVASVPLLPDAIEADASLATGEVLAQSLVTSLNGGTALNSVQDSSSGANTALIASQAVTDVLNRVKAYDSTGSLNAVQTVDQTQACVDAGTVTFNGTIDDVTYAINLTTTYAGCNENGVTTNGAFKIVGSMDYSNSTGSVAMTVPSTYTLTDNATGFYMSIYSGTSLSVELTSTQVILNQTIKIDANGQLYGSAGTRWILGLSDGSAYQTSGREYLNNLTSYIDYDTSYDMSATPFVNDGAGGIASGRTRYVFSNGARIQLTVNNNSVFVEVDADADGIYELSSTITI